MLLLEPASSSASGLEDPGVTLREAPTPECCPCCSPFPLPLPPRCPLPPVKCPTPCLHLPLLPSLSLLPASPPASAITAQLLPDLGLPAALQ